MKQTKKKGRSMKHKDHYNDDYIVILSKKIFSAAHALPGIV